jgi:hypothetical protein
MRVAAAVAYREMMWAPAPERHVAIERPSADTRRRTLVPA